VIRVRAEADQFLLSCHKIETFVLWLQSFFAAIDLAPPLDDREIPRDLSVPRRSRRQTREREAGRNAELVQEQQEIIENQFPRLDETSRPQTADSQTSAPSVDTILEDPESALTWDPAATPSPPSTSAGTSINEPPSRGPSLVTRARQAMQSTAHLAQYAPSAPNPSISPEGKWRPQHKWTQYYDMMYAKRCMAILTHRSPRKSNLMIMKGKQWVVDWATGVLTRCEPPDYYEVTTADKQGSDVSFGQYRQLHLEGV